GILNNEASSYDTASHKVKSLEGGTKGFFNEFNSTSDVGVEKSPTELYAYGIVKRDYFGLQFAKMLPEYNPDSKNSATGGSMGGFRSVMAAAFDSSIKTVNAAYTWMASVGGRENDKIAGGFMPAHTIGIQYFSTVNAAAMLGSDVTLNFTSCGLGDYTSPPAGIIAAYNAATCNKTIELRQYREHGTTRTTRHYDMFRQAASVKTEAVAMPSGLNGQTLTETQVLNEYRGYTDYRIAQILTTKDEIKPQEGGKAYYVSNNGSSSNDGLTTATPLKTIEDVNNLESKLKAGDVVYFERGSIFRGQLKANVDGVTYAAYGTGEKPEIYGARGNAAVVGRWIQTAENKNVYRYTKTYISDVGNIVFNGGEANGIKCIIRTEDDGTYNNTTGKKFDSYADLDEDLHFYHDNETDTIYLYCSYGNPAFVFDSIEICIGANIITVKGNNVRIDNLSIKYGGAHGVGTNTRKGLTVTNCEFQWIGGSIQSGVQYAKNYPTRFGNGVEIYGGCDKYTIKNCYFNQIYDVAVTFQYNNKTAEDIIMQNVDFSDNVIEHCNYSFEYFLTASDNGTGSYIKNVKYDNNLSWYAGYGLCEQRPDKGNSAHVKSWEHYNSLQGTFEITNNLFAISRDDLVQSNAKTGEHSPTYSGNTYIQFNDGYLGTSREVQEKVLFNNTVASQIKSMLGDNDSTVIYVKR
ncbi:MAG: acetylxylan esterase, partial [Clostridia bacterium]|nr:acetylxylan esterase [Clostridia bacterium]